MKVEPMVMLLMILAEWLNRQREATWRALRLLSGGRLMDGINKLTALNGEMGPSFNRMTMLLVGDGDRL